MLFRSGFVGRQIGGRGSSGPPGVALDLSFMIPGTLDPRITFTRASIGTYYDVAGVLQTATANTPRWDYDPVTHALRGLLIEEQRLNNMLQSGDFTNAAWNKGNCTLSAGTIGPNGAVTGSGMISNNGTTGLLSENFTSVAGTTYTSSCFVRPGTLSSVTMLMPLVWWTDAVNRTATYNLSTGIVTQVLGGTASAAMVPVGGGWYRVSLTATPDLSASGAVRFAGASAVGDGVSVQHYAFGAQLEVGAFATSYIPTTAAAVTRARDICTQPIAAWFDATKGSLLFEYMVEGAVVGFTSPVQFIGASANTDYIAVDEYTSAGATPTSPTLAAVEVFTASAQNAITNYTAVAVPAGVVHKGGASWIVGARINAAHDGVASVSFSGNITALPVIATLSIAGPYHFQPQVSLWARRVTYWPRALTSAELQQVTT